MKKFLPILLVLLLLLTGCGNDKPVETDPAGEDTPIATNPEDAEGILDPATEIRYLLAKMIVTNDAGQELWGREYGYDETGFCIQEREYSNIAGSAYSRVNTPDALGRIGNSYG